MQVHEDACGVQPVERREFLNRNATHLSWCDVDWEGAEQSLRHRAGKGNVDIGAEAVDHRLEIRFGAASALGIVIRGVRLSAAAMLARE
jgi:hypothetical protein